MRVALLSLVQLFDTVKDTAVGKLGSSDARIVVITINVCILQKAKRLRTGNAIIGYAVHKCFLERFSDYAAKTCIQVLCNTSTHM